MNLINKEALLEAVTKLKTHLMERGNLRVLTVDFDSTLDIINKAPVVTLAKQEISQEEIDYPRDLFNAVIGGNSPYAFYLFQWVPYQTEAKKWRLKMHHDVKTFDGREAFNIWPNADSCGPFKDHEVEFIRISKNSFGREYVDPKGKQDED